MSIFKSYDIRGVWGEDLTADAVCRIGRAMATLLRSRTDEPRVVVGGDVRTSTEAVRGALHEGLTRGGVRVIDAGVVPTPVFYYAVRTLDPDAAAMITASHNPPQFNGLKVSLDRNPINPDKIQHLRKVVEGGEYAEGSGSVEHCDVWAGYHRSMRELFPGGFGLKVVADAGNGAWSENVVDTLARLGFEAVGLFCEPDGRFPNRPADPSKAANIAALRRVVPYQGAALGVAFDGDGDRAVFVDETGEPVNPDKILVALARDALARCADPSAECVVHDSICSRLVPQAIRQAGARPVMERVGYTFIRERVLREEALFGGELSGHFFYRELNANDDGMYSFLRCARMVQEAGRPLSAILGEMDSWATTPALRIAFGEQEGREASKPLHGGAKRRAGCRV